MRQRHSKLTYSFNLQRAEVGRRLSDQVARPGRFWLSRKYAREPWLEGIVSETGFLLWVKRPGTYPPMPFAKARGTFVETATGCKVEVRLPLPQKLPGALLPAFLLGWLITSPLAALDFIGSTQAAWAPYFAGFFAAASVVALLLARASAEAQELERKLCAILGQLGE